MKRIAFVGAWLVVGCLGGSDSPGPVAFTPTLGNADPGANTRPGAAPAVNETCAPGSIDDVEVPAQDLRRFPPYSVSGCRLAYVNRDGDLRLRDLTTGVETTLAGRDEAPHRPTVSHDVVAWEATIDGRTRVRIAHGGATAESPSELVAANEPRASGGVVAFTAWSSAPPQGDADVWLFDAALGSAKLVLGGAGQQRFADVSKDWVAISDFSEDPDGRFDDDGRDLADIVLVSRSSGEVVHRPLPGKQAFPMLVDDAHVGYLDWNAVHPEPKLEAYTIRVGGQRSLPTDDRTIADVSSPGAPAFPIAHDGIFEWISANDGGDPTLFRAPADQSKPPIPSGPGVPLELGVPSANQSLTIAPGRIVSGAVTTHLRAIPR
jgi:hypothetical protein